MLEERAAERQRRQRMLWRVMFGLAAVWTAWVSLMPVDSLPDVNLWDKLAHACTYAVLMSLLLPALSGEVSRPRVVVAGGWVMLYGVAIEVAQGMTGYRFAEWQDALANLVGIVSAGFLWHLRAKIRNVRRG